MGCTVNFQMAGNVYATHLVSRIQMQQNQEMTENINRPFWAIQLTEQFYCHVFGFCQNSNFLCDLLMEKRVHRKSLLPSILCSTDFTSHNLQVGHILKHSQEPDGCCKESHSITVFGQWILNILSAKNKISKIRRLYIYVIKHVYRLQLFSFQIYFEVVHSKDISCTIAKL